VYRVANFVCQMHHFARRSAAETRFVTAMASHPVHGMNLLQAVRLREEVLVVGAPDHQAEPQAEVRGIPLGFPGEARRHRQWGQRPRRPAQRVLQRRPIIPALRNLRPGPYGPPVRAPTPVPDVAVPAMRLRRESSMADFLNRRTVTPPASPDLFHFNLMNQESDDDDAATVKLEPEDED